MYPFLHELLMDKKGGEIFTLFSPWHFFYILFTTAVIAAVLVAYRKRKEAMKKAIRVLGNLAFGLYILDFFLMPIAYNQIDIEKLPFHVCTAMCVMCFLSDRVEFLTKYRSSFVLLGFLSNLVYLIYPAGVMWHEVYPLSYRVIQTLIFHSVMTAYGFLTLVCTSEEFQLKLWRKDLTILVGMTAWAVLGNYLYNGTSEEYSHFFNWFFVVRDPFYLLPESFSPFIMPLLNVGVFFAAERIVLWIVQLIKYGKTQ